MCKRSCRHRSIPGEPGMLGGLHVQTSAGERAEVQAHGPRRAGGRCYPGPYLGRAKLGLQSPQGACLSPWEHTSVKRQRVPRGWAGWDCPLPPAAPPRAKGPAGGGCTPCHPPPHPRPGQHTLGRQGYLLPAPPRTPEWGRSGALAGRGSVRGGAFAGRGFVRGGALTGAGGCGRAGLCQGRGFGGGGALAGRSSQGYLTWGAWPPCPLAAPPSGRSPGRPPRAWGLASRVRPGAEQGHLSTPVNPCGSQR